MPMNDTIQAVLAADDRRLAALETDDTDTLAALLDADFVYLHANGRVDDCRSLLARIAAGQVQHRALVRHQAQVRPCGETAVVSGRFSMDVSHPPATEPLHLDNHFLAVWRKHGGTWRLLALASVRHPHADR